MKPEEINIAIAEHLDMAGTHRQFHRDLNAMHEAEVNLDGEQWGTYSATLERFTRRDLPKWMPDWKRVSPSRVIDVSLIHATAMQRAEAFLRTVGKWKETPVCETCQGTGKQGAFPCCVCFPMHQSKVEGGPA